MHINAFHAPGATLIKYGSTLKKILSLFSIALLLSACGGGGGGDSTPASPLARYAGTWSMPCENSVKSTATYTAPPGTSDSLNVVFKDEAFDKQDCTGTPLATITISAKTILTHIGSVEASVALSPTAKAALISVDKFTSFRDKGTVNVSGPGVKVETLDGVRYWVISYGDGNKGYVTDQGELDTRTDSGNAYVSGNTLYYLNGSGTAFQVVAQSTKVR